MTKQWMRKLSLIVGDADGHGIDLSEMHIVFSVRMADVQSPNTANIRIYNLSDATVAKLRAAAAKRGSSVILKVGYGDALATIFTGTMIQPRTGRENATDTFLDILAADGDQAYNFATINQTLAAGWESADLHRAILAALQPYGITAGYTPEWKAPKACRGTALFGMVRDALRTLAAAEDCSWSFDGGKLNLTPRLGCLPGDAVVLTDKTGMVGIPQQTADGITVRCLLNPAIVRGQRLKIDNASIVKAQYSTAWGSQGNNDMLNLPFDADGFYRALVVDHSGDTRGNAWYTDIICVGIDATVPLSLSARGIAP